MHHRIIDQKRIRKHNRFPSDDFIKYKWVCIVQSERSENDWIPTKSSTICSEHFKQEDIYTTSKGYLRLKKTAAPFMEQDIDNAPKCVSPSSVDQVDISDMVSVFDSPRKAMLKTRVRKLVVEKKKVTKKNKVLKILNHRLLKRITNMKNITKVLKKRNYLMNLNLTAVK